MASSRAIERVAQGVYRMAGAPRQQHEAIYATWLALGGAAADRTDSSVPPLVASGPTAAVLHEIGDFLPDRLDFIVPKRKGTRLPGVRLRIRQLTPDDVMPVGGLPTLSVERTIVDLVDIGTDTSLISGALTDAVQQGKVIDPDRLRSGLIARRRPDNDTGQLEDHLERLLAAMTGGTDG